MKLINMPRFQLGEARKQDACGTLKKPPSMDNFLISGLSCQ